MSADQGEGSEGSPRYIGPNIEDSMHELQASPPLRRSSQVGVVISIIFLAAFITAVCVDVRGSAWTVGIGISGLVWAVTYWTDFWFRYRDETEEREYLLGLVTEVSTVMIGSFSKGSPQTDLWLKRHGFPGALQHVLEEGVALHVRSAVHAGGPNGALGRWRAIRNTLENARQRLHRFLDPPKQQALAEIIFSLETTLAQVQVAKKRPERDIDGFQGEVQNELEAVTGAFHQIVASWLQMWNQPVPAGEDRSNVGPSARDKTKPLIKGLGPTYYYLWRDHAYDVELESSGLTT